MHISVQTEDFDVTREIKKLTADRKDIGAIASFVGLVRDLKAENLVSMTLEQYPGMTEKALAHIAESALQRWAVQDISVIHRYGELKPAEQIVLVIVISEHRSIAFQACEFIMDKLKTEAPFWKKETTNRGSRWVEAKESDNKAKQRWSL